MLTPGCFCSLMRQNRLNPPFRVFKVFSSMLAWELFQAAAQNRVLTCRIQNNSVHIYPSYFPFEFQVRRQFKSDGNISNKRASKGLREPRIAPDGLKRPQRATEVFKGPKGGLRKHLRVSGSLGGLYGASEGFWVSQKKKERVLLPVLICCLFMWRK